MPAPSDVTGLLLRWRDGDQEAFDELVPTLYEQLKRMARARLRNEASDQTLNTTALVHEAYLELIDIDRIQWQDRAHFLAMASRVMRRVLIDHAIRKKAQKRGGGATHVAFDEQVFTSRLQVTELIDLNDFLQKLERAHPRQAQSLELYYLGGLTQQEIAEVSGVSQPTVLRDLQFAKAWLARALSENPSGAGRAND